MTPKTKTVRHSELRAFRECPLKRKWVWEDLWTREEAGVRSMGTAWHLVLQVHYTELQRQQQRWLETADSIRGFKPDTSAVEDLVWATIDSLPDSLDHDLLDWMYEGYREKWGFDESWEILHAEVTQEVPLLLPTGKPSRFRYRWTSDVVVRDRSMRNRVLVVDHKSTKQQMKKQFDVDLDDQFGLYMLAWKRLGLDVLAPVCNQARTDRLKREMTIDERFARMYSHRTEAELREIELDALATAKAIYSKANQERPYSNPDPRVCSWKCDFKEVHLILRKNPDQDLEHVMLSRGYVRRNEVP